jgi:dienelactone hydrolase
MKLKWPSRRRALRWIAILVLVAIAVLYLVLPVAFGIAVVFPNQKSVGAPPEGFEDMTLTTEDDVTLKAWYAPPANGAAIILIHGAGDSRDAVRRYAEMLARHGYGVLALDLRGHGESGGATNRLGWRGTRDVKAAVAYLQARDDVTAIGGLGLSLGGEVLLGAASECPALQAIVADGATQRSIAELRALESERPLYRNFTARVMFATVWLLSGDDPPSPTLLDSMIQAESTVFLLIAGGSNALEVDFNQMFAAAVGERAALWVAPDAPHTGAFRRYPGEYEQRVIAFFDATLPDDPTAPTP